MLDDLVEEGGPDPPSCAILAVLAVSTKVKSGSSAIGCGVTEVAIGATVAMGAT